MIRRGKPCTNEQVHFHETTVCSIDGIVLLEKIDKRPNHGKLCILLPIISPKLTKDWLAIRHGQRMDEDPGDVLFLQGVANLASYLKPLGP